jgi:hypothetical protein
MDDIKVDIVLVTKMSLPVGLIKIWMNIKVHLIVQIVYIFFILISLV